MESGQANHLVERTKKNMDGPKECSSIPLGGDRSSLSAGRTKEEVEDALIYRSLLRGTDSESLDCSWDGWMELTMQAGAQPC